VLVLVCMSGQSHKISPFDCFSHGAPQHHTHCVLGGHVARLVSGFVPAGSHVDTSAPFFIASHIVLPPAPVPRTQLAPSPFSPGMMLHMVFFGIQHLHWCTHLPFFLVGVWSQSASWQYTHGASHMNVSRAPATPGGPPQVSWFPGVVRYGVPKQCGHFFLKWLSWIVLKRSLQDCTLPPKSHFPRSFPKFEPGK